MLNTIKTVKIKYKISNSTIVEQNTLKESKTKKFNDTFIKFIRNKRRNNITFN